MSEKEYRVQFKQVTTEYVDVIQCAVDAKYALTRVFTRHEHITKEVLHIRIEEISVEEVKGVNPLQG